MSPYIYPTLDDDFFKNAMNKEYFKNIIIKSGSYDNLIKGISKKEYMFSGIHSNKYEKNNSCVKKRKIYLEEPVAFEDIEFEYYINEDGFRGRSLNKFNKNNINVLFIGCSITQAVGLPEEQSWYKKLIDKMIQDNPGVEINYYNLSVSGIGFEIILKNMITFLNNVGKPDFIFCLIPQISRQLRWHNTGYSNAHLKIEEIALVVPEWMRSVLNPLPREVDVLHTDSYSVEDSLMKFSSMIHFAETLCNLSGIKFIWATWFKDHGDIFKNPNIGFKNYLNLNIKLSDGFFVDKKNLGSVEPTWMGEESNESYSREDKTKKQYLDSFNINNEPFWTSARDGWHPGAYTHTIISDKFYKELCIRYNNYMEGINEK
jgi:hypothetical protein